MIAIVDYGVGNLFSLRSSLEFIGADCAVTSDKAAIAAAEKIILPGVGAFGAGADALRATGLGEVVIREAARGKPLMGICLGMQLLYEESHEHGIHKGLGLLPGAVLSLREALEGQNLKVPHMGWNTLTAAQEHPLLTYATGRDYVYYVHSFYAPVTETTMAWSQYGTVKVTGIAAKGNVCGSQFHPEKSGAVGLNMLRAFAEI
jgi:glutamine amidotransferase